MAVTGGTKWMSSGADVVSAAIRVTVGIAGKHDADPNLEVLHRRRVPHRAGHECRISIPLMAAFVYVASVRIPVIVISQSG
jgi:hypothetical protein